MEIYVYFLVEKVEIIFFLFVLIILYEKMNNVVNTG